MAANYTDEQVRKMVIEYTITPDRETVDRLAKELDKSTKSIIGKLSREGVYQKAIYKTKSGEVPMTKAEIIVSLAEMLEIDSTKIIGLEKAPKQDIKYIYEIIKEKQNG
jgi:hypothetical protein|tara:strand:+ start:610 stop:936 length:327 start_codon:yes stop_codon:yes gene_type:complete